MVFRPVQGPGANYPFICASHKTETVVVPRGHSICESRKKRKATKKEYERLFFFQNLKWRVTLEGKDGRVNPTSASIAAGLSPEFHTPSQRNYSATFMGLQRNLHFQKCKHQRIWTSLRSWHRWAHLSASLRVT